MKSTEPLLQIGPSAEVPQTWESEMPLQVVLRGDSTSDEIRWMASAHPNARLRKLRSECCTYAMPRRDSYKDGPRFQIFASFNEEPLLLDAIDHAKLLGMTVNGQRAYWDIQEALRQGFIEIADTLLSQPQRKVA